MTEVRSVSPDAETELRRLRWQCRRGMLELDHLLSRFLDLGYADLSEGERLTLAELLGEQDQRLHDWLIAGGAPSDPRFVALVTRIREVARERPRGG